MMKSAVAILISLLPAVQASALIEVGSAIRATDGIPAWIQSYRTTVDKMKTSNSYPADGYTECRETEEVKSAYLCISNTQKGMNSSLGRASFFIEGLGGANSKGKVVSQDNGTYQMYKNMIGGHDLKGQDLLRFNDTVTKECATSKQDANICHNAYEKDLFENFILPFASQDPKFVVITFASQSSMQWEDVVTHEILHAQYFNDDQFRAIADEFWEKEVSAEDKKQIISELSQHYDPTDALLMRNEFQAYMLMAGAEYSQLSMFVPKYRDALMKKLVAKGIQPIQVQ